VATSFFCVGNNFFPTVYIIFYWNIGYRPLKMLWKPHECYVSSVPLARNRLEQTEQRLLDDLHKSAVHFVYCGPTASSASSPENYHKTIIKNSGRKKTPRAEALRVC